MCMKGFLYKRGRGKSISFVKPWAYRWFELDADAKELSYFAENSRGTKSFRGLVVVRHGSVQMCSSDPGRPFSFDLNCFNSTGQEEKVTLAAPTKEEMESWIKAIGRVAPCDTSWLKVDVGPAAPTGNDVDAPATKSSQGEKHGDDSVLACDLFKMDNFTRSWCTRHLQLDTVSKTLSIFVESGGKRIMRGSMNLLNGSVTIESEQEVRKPYAFRICCASTHTNSDEEVIVLAATDFETFEKWTDALTNMMGCTLVSPPFADTAGESNDTNMPGHGIAIATPFAAAPSSGYTVDDIDDEGAATPPPPPPPAPSGYEMDDIDEDGDVPAPPPPPTYASNDIDEDSVDDSIPPFTALRGLDSGEVGNDDADGVADIDGSSESNDSLPHPHIVFPEDVPPLSQPTDDLGGYNFEKHVERRRSLSPKSEAHPPPPPDRRNRTSSESSAEPQHFKHTSNMSEEDLRTVPIQDALLSPKVLSGERPRLTLRNALAMNVGLGSSTPRGVVLPQPSLPDGHSPELPNLDDLHIMISLTDILHSAKLLRKRLHLKRLFQTEDDVVPFELVREALQREQDDPQPSSSFPYLSHNGCVWSDVLRYLNYEERFKRARGTGIEMSFRIDIVSSRQSFYFCCDMSSTWAETCVKQIRKIPNAAIEISSEESIRQVVLRQVPAISEQIAKTFWLDLASAEDYVMILEEHALQFENATKSSPISGNHGDINRSARGDEHTSLDEAFDAADMDGNGVISRKEWRLWMVEKEAIIAKANKDKAELVKENKNLRRALNPISHQTYTELKRAEDHLDSCRADLEEAHFEIKRLKSQLAAAKRRGSSGSESLASSLSGLNGLENKYGLPDRLGTRTCDAKDREAEDDSSYEHADQDVGPKSHSFDNTQQSADNSYSGLPVVDLSRPIPTSDNAAHGDLYRGDSIDAAIAAEMKQFEAGLNGGSNVHTTLEEWENSLLGGSPPIESWVKRFAQPASVRSAQAMGCVPEGTASVRRLPPSISQSFAEHEQLDDKKNKKKKPTYGRPTLLHARDHDLYESRVIESSESESEDEACARRLSRTPPNKKEHPLREALRMKSDKLAMVKTAYVFDAPPLSRPLVSMSPHRSPSPQRQHTRAVDVPANKRYLISPTDSSMAKMKRHPSAQVVAARMPGDWH